MAAMAKGCIGIYTRRPADELIELRRWAAEEWPHMQAREYVDTESGRIFDSPAFMRMRADIDSGEVGAIASFEFDGLSRDFAASIDLMRGLLRRKIDVLIPGGGVELFAERLGEYRRMANRGGGPRPGNPSRTGVTKYTDDQIQRVRMLRDDGLSLRDIEERTGVPRASVVRILKKE